MAKLKSRKSITKRFKVTKKGKIFRRPSGQDHYLSKKSGETKRKGRKMIEVSKNEIKKIKRILGI